METEVQPGKIMLCVTENGLRLYSDSWRPRVMDGAYPEMVLRGLRIQRECVENYSSPGCFPYKMLLPDPDIIHSFFLASEHME